jgi:protein phosphatase
VDTLNLVRHMVSAGSALCVPGNHDVKLLKALQGKNVRVTHGLEQTLAEIEAVPEPARTPLKQQLAEFLDSLVSHYVLDDGRLVVAHAGMKAEYQGRASGRVREFALYGETTGETDEFGLPVRHNWAAEYRGRAMVVYGHTPVPEPEWINHTINIDTGCVFGGKLTALRYPERELVQVSARRQYCEPARPFLPTIPADDGMTAQQVLDEVLDLDDVSGKRLIETRIGGIVTIRAENSTAALEVMSRFAANPKWLVYLPPTMSPSETSSLDGYLEHPAEAFAYYRSHDVPRVICQEKHMGSRAVVIIGRDEEAIKARFGIVGEGRGICVTRTGRPFFDDGEVQRQFLDRIHAAIDSADWWHKFASDWFCLDCELMPWSAKAQELLRRQYAPTGAAAQAMLAEASRLLADAAARTDGEYAEAIRNLAERTSARGIAAGKYAQAWRRYCWPVGSMDDLRLAPFHVLASEGAVHTDKNHLWHMETLAELAAAQPAGSKLFMATRHLTIDVHDKDSVQRGIEWWESLTAAGGEGMVVKPLDWVQKYERTLVQPAVKCRGREYLRIIYGPEYDTAENLMRLRKRGLGAKRSLAAREFALGVDALERFVRRETLMRVHECVFGVLALESEPVDPRL